MPTYPQHLSLRLMGLFNKLYRRQSHQTFLCQPAEPLTIYPVLNRGSITITTIDNVQKFNALLCKRGRTSLLLFSLLKKGFNGLRFNNMKLSPPRLTCQFLCLCINEHHAYLALWPMLSLLASPARQTVSEIINYSLMISDSVVFASSQLPLLCLPFCTLCAEQPQPPRRAISVCVLSKRKSTQVIHNKSRVLIMNSLIGAIGVKQN